MGFSLGSQVIASCLEMLDELGVRHIIQDVTFLGGAVDRFDSKNGWEKWARIFSNQIPGQIKNVHTQEDFALIAYR